MHHAHQTSRFDFLDHPFPLAFAHRGAHESAEESTMPALAEAVRLGFRYIETDVQVSRDGVPILFHDDTLARVLGRNGRVRDHSSHELAQLRTPGGETLVRLDEALSTFPRTRFNLDAKSDAAVAPMADAIRRCGALGRVCVGSFDVRRTLRLRELLGAGLCWSPSARGVGRLWLAGWGLPMAAIAFPVAQIPTHYRGIPLATQRFVAAAHARGVQVHVWTVDEEGEMERLLDMGVDGLMTDRPRLLKQVLMRRGEWSDEAA